MKLNDLIACLLDLQRTHGGDTEVRINAVEVDRIANDGLSMMVPADVSGYNDEFDCIEIF